jgi:hypothetical protein
MFGFGPRQAVLEAIAEAIWPEVRGLGCARSWADVPRPSGHHRSVIRIAERVMQSVGELEGGATADDLRAQGWMVAVHNDYRQGGELRTFWLVTRTEEAIKGEGASDAEALAQIRARIREKEETGGD